MHTSNLIKLLSKLNKDEWKQFQKFVHSPYFNSNKSAIQFLALLKKYYPVFDSPKLKKEKVFQKLFPKQAYKEKRMWQLISDLKGLAEQFLVVEKNDKSSTHYQLQLKEAFYEKDLYDWFEQKSETLAKKLNQKEGGETLNQFHLHQIHHHWYFNSQSVKTTPKHPNLVAASEHLQIYYHIQQLKYACEWASRSIRIKEELPLFVQNITYRSQFADNFLYQFYYNIFYLFTAVEKNNHQLFESLFTKLKTHISSLPHKDQIALLIYLINYGIRKVQLSQENYTLFVFQLYQLGLEENRLIYKGILSDNIFMNIVGTASKMKAFDWIENFMEEYKPYLKTSSLLPNIGWTKAIVQFHQGNFSEAIKSFDTFSFKLEKRELTRRSVQIKACLECFLRDFSYYELLKNKSLSFEKYLTRKKNIDDTKRKVYANLNLYIRTLSRLLYENQSIGYLESLHKKVINEKEMGAKDWLLSHIEKCINGFKSRQKDRFTQSSGFSIIKT